MLNHIVLMGRLTRDPELRRTGSGLAVVSFSLAVDRDFGNRETGDRETDFIDIVAWRNTAEFVSKYFTKGRMAVVSGRLQIRNWTDKEGNKRRSAEGRTTSTSATASATIRTPASAPTSPTVPPLPTSAATAPPPLPRRSATSPCWRTRTTVISPSDPKLNFFTNPNKGGTIHG